MWAPAGARSRRPWWPPGDHGWRHLLGSQHERRVGGRRHGARSGARGRRPRPMARAGASSSATTGTWTRTMAPMPVATRSQTIRPASSPISVPRAGADHGHDERLPRDHALSLPRPQADGADHGEVPTAPPDADDERVGEAGAADQREEAREQPGRRPDGGQVLDDRRRTDGAEVGRDRGQPRRSGPPARSAPGRRTTAGPFLVDAGRRTDSLAGRAVMTARSAAGCPAPRGCRGRGRPGRG